MNPNTRMIKGLDVNHTTINSFGFGGRTFLLTITELEMYILSIHSVIPSSKDPKQLAGKMYLEWRNKISDLFERNEMRRLR
ncbi:MAG: hypothetical protein IPM04_14780 [Saprospiraceae bacterium]|nr:hypothetical protein [Candidatus Brachybacter algidus]MBK8749034.1 hypothetical protein [Candidatus Brachybacter algidus]